MKKFFKKPTKIQIIMLVGLIIGIGLLCSPVFNRIIFETKLSEIKSISKHLSNGEVRPATYYDEKNIYDIMHKMANSKIVAVDGKVWGTLPMDKDDIIALKETVSKIDYSDRDYLLGVLNNWEKEDFSHCVEEHNYFWNKLGGTIGKAYKLKDDN